jgi:ATP-dependent RNA helicase DeaD
LHGDLSQAQRDGVMKSFRGRQIQMLVADVAARGIDVDNITHVVKLPDEIETYNHRSVVWTCGKIRYFYRNCNEK